MKTLHGGSGKLESVLATGILLLAGVFLLNGCSIPVKQGEVTHHLVIGFGIVSTYEGTNQPVSVTRVQALGAYVSNQPGLKVGIGACSSTAVSVSTNAEDVRIEVRTKPGSGLTIDAASAKLKTSP